MSRIKRIFPVPAPISCSLVRGVFFCCCSCFFSAQDVVPGVWRRWSRFPAASCARPNRYFITFANWHLVTIFGRLNCCCLHCVQADSGGYFPERSTFRWVSLSEEFFPRNNAHTHIKVHPECLGSCPLGCKKEEEKILLERTAKSSRHRWSIGGGLFSLAFQSTLFSPSLEELRGTAAAAGAALNTVRARHSPVRAVCGKIEPEPLPRFMARAMDFCFPIPRAYTARKSRHLRCFLSGWPQGLNSSVPLAVCEERTLFGEW